MCSVLTSGVLADGAQARKLADALRERPWHNVTYYPVRLSSWQQPLAPSDTRKDCTMQMTRKTTALPCLRLCYTLLLASASAFTVLPIRHERAPTVVGTHLEPIAFLGELPMAYAVSAKLGVKSIKELIDLSKREPDKIFYAANATGTLPHMAGEYFKSRTGASLTFVPFRGTADALAGVLSGQIMRSWRTM